MLFSDIVCFNRDYKNLQASLIANGFILAPCVSRNNNTAGVSCFDKLDNQFAKAFWISHSLSFDSSPAPR